MVANPQISEGNITPKVIGGVSIAESERPPDLVNMKIIGEFIFCENFAQDFLLRRKFCEKISAAQKSLPHGYRFMLYEAFRPRSRQIVLWNGILSQLRKEHPDWSEEQRENEADAKYVANPYGFGSGHQSGAAVDITLCTQKGEELFMGTRVQEFCALTPTDAIGIKKVERERRNILRQALESEGAINYPDEWWHFCYGDRLWAEVTHRDSAFFAPID